MAKLSKLSNAQINAAVEAFQKAGYGQNEVMWKCWLQGMEFAEAAVRKECEARIIMLENDRDGMHRNWDAACHDIAELQAKCEAES